ncbi:Fe2+/Zn2+ uptake regulation protein [Synechococcus sp. PCC 7502]|uniref:Fur family transcriptional regulator n=1 Tax=Synechococcus sp. PCC 7502 TaxID=1173263 RepID=UPI00029FAB7B|nr:Fur family transcriptional regulator [Synechococcus sp. PCC 7502]AFY74965.1 Fe2+/Zn2+ uptake regulation protein [Synechococcus sp. PCC 7502]
MKLTRSQQKVLDLLQHLSQAISAQDIYTQLRQRSESMGLATVYRSLEVLKTQGLIKGITLPNGEAIYSPMPSDRHHLNCLNCGALIQIDSCPLHNLNSSLEQSYNFKIQYHTLEFFGLCSQCEATITKEKIEK